MGNLDDEKIKLIQNVAEILKLAEEEIKIDNPEEADIITFLDLEDLKSLKALYDLCIKEINENIRLKDKIRNLKQFYIDDLTARNNEFVPVSNLVKNLNLLLDESVDL